MDIHVTRVDSPIGRVVIYTRNAAVVALGFESGQAGLVRHLERHFGSVDLIETKKAAGAAARVTDYFKGDLKALDSVAVDLAGTPFQRKVWARLRAIPPGTTTTYAAIAKAVGRPKAVRAVGTANGSNPVSIVIPCHRVIGSDGRLHGYGGGLHRKEWLLEHEVKNTAV